VAHKNNTFKEQHPYFEMHRSSVLDKKIILPDEDSKQQDEMAKGLDFRSFKP